jgi:hypothetical protein
VSRPPSIVETLPDWAFALLLLLVVFGAVAIGQVLLP